MTPKNWYWVAAGAGGTHYGVLDASLRAVCGSNFPAVKALLLELPPGDRPADPAQMCSECRIIADHDSKTHRDTGPPLLRTPNQ